MSLKFVPGEPALVYKKNLIISDIHIGIEYDLYKSGIKIPSQTDKIAERILKICKKEKIEKLFVLGDLKHEVPGTSWQELRELPIFFNKICKRVTVEIIPGNHDGGLEKILDIKFHPSIGIRVGDLYLTHGHSWPSSEFLECEYIVVGHTHPMIEIIDKMGYKHRERCWIRADFKKKVIREKFKATLLTKRLIKKSQTLPKLIVLPAFNEFSGGISMNRKWLEEGEKKKRFIGPLVKAADIEHAEVFLLDGTYLGLVKDIK